jgi:hypothetical protein
VETLLSPLFFAASIDPSPHLWHTPSMSAFVPRLTSVMTTS